MAKVSVVIINYNGRKYLEKFLPSILASTYSDMELIIADNASTDDSLAFMRSTYPAVRIIVLKRNHGYAGGYNEALKEVKSDYYVLLNSDVEVSPGWIEPVIELMESDKGIGACQPKILSYKQKNQFEYAGAAGGWLDCLGYPFARGRIFDICELDSGQYNEWRRYSGRAGLPCLSGRNYSSKPVAWIPIFLPIWRRSISAGACSCWAIASMPVRPPKSTMWAAAPCRKGNERKVFLNFRNNMIMLAKNLPKRQSFWKIPLRILLDFISAFKSLFAGQIVYFLAVGEAHLAFFKWLFFMQKKSVFPVKRKARLSGWYLNCVAWKHFVEGKETFDEIVGDKR